MKPVPSYPPETLEAMRVEFTDLLLETKRPGMEDLLAWLDGETDFFTAPASTQFHGAIRGGLISHSLTVYKLLGNFTKKLEVSQDSLRIAGLLHDLCKANLYATKVRNVKVPGERRWEEEESFCIEDNFPMGHGEKSVYLAMKYIQLTDEQALAIRWHMGGYDDAARAYVGGMTQSNAFRQYPMAAALSIADMYAAYLIER